MIKVSDFSKIKRELQKYFPEAQSIQNEKESEKREYQTFYLYLNDMNEKKRMILKFSKDYLENHNLDEFKKHLQRNIYYVLKSNINRTVYLMKNFEIEVDDLQVSAH